MATNDTPTTRNCGAIGVFTAGCLAGVRELTGHLACPARRRRQISPVRSELCGRVLTGPVLRIPSVVARVVCKEGRAQRLRDEQIHSQIEVLNRDFRAADT